jgi:hypothetical protein
MVSATGDFLGLDEVFASLEHQFGTITPADLRKNRLSLATTFAVTDDLRTFFGSQEDAHRFAALAGKESEIGKSEKVAYLRDAVTPCGHFNTVIAIWEQANFSNELQTYENLKAALQTHWANHSITSTAVSLGYAAAAKTLPAQQVPQLQETPLTSLSAESLVALVAAAVRASQPSTASPAQSAQPQANNNRASRKSYCWSHGYGNHSGHECLKRRDGHKEDATGPDNNGGRRGRKGY